MATNVQKKRKEYWSDGHVILLIKALEEVNVNNLLDSKRYRNIEIFEKVKQELGKYGVVKSIVQIQTKYKALKGK